MLSACSNVHHLLPSGNEQLEISRHLKPKPSVNLSKQDLKEALNMKRSVETTTSSFDTAWVAMVPSSSKIKPQFPKSLKWILENQNADGSWASDDPLLNIKDSLTSTLASVLALHKWNSADRLVHKGLDFIVSNVNSVATRNQNSPLGFDIVFPGMIEYARHSGLNIVIDQSSLDQLLLNRHSHIKYLEGHGPNLASVAEGLIGSSYLHHWNEIMKCQRSNGSLLNSPSTTAAAFLQLGDENCFRYLDSLANEFEGGVPFLHPIDIYTRLSMVDDLKKLGIYTHFSDEIHGILDHVYRCWMQGSEEIFSDTKCLAMAFSLLRLHGYQVSSENLADYGRKEFVTDSLSEYNKDTKSVLELYKASQAAIFRIEPVLDRIQEWTAKHLQHELSSRTIREPSLRAEVDHALEHPYASLDRIENKLFIENYCIDNIGLHKTLYKLLGIDVRDLVAFSAKEFNFFQAIYRRELQQLEGWVRKYDLQSYFRNDMILRFAYLSHAAENFEPHLSDARAASTHYSVLATVFDDFFDDGGTMSELLNLIELVKRWDDYSSIGFGSQDVEVLFHALYGTINETAAIAHIHQGRCIKSELVHIWIRFLKSMLKEVEWAKHKTVPTMDEYLSNGYVSFGLGPVVLIPLYLMGHRLPREVIEGQEYNDLYIHMSTIGRLLNDKMSVKRESEQGKLNSVTLQVIHNGGSMTEEAAQEEVTRMIESHRRELLRMVVNKRKSEVPSCWEDMFWVSSKILHFFYNRNDGYSSPTKMITALNSLIHGPISTY